MWTYTFVSQRIRHEIVQSKTGRNSSDGSTIGHAATDLDLNFSCATRADAFPFISTWRGEQQFLFGLVFGFSSPLTSNLNLCVRVCLFESPATNKFIRSFNSTEHSFRMFYTMLCLWKDITVDPQFVIVDIFGERENHFRINVYLLQRSFIDWIANREGLTFVGVTDEQ